MTREADARPLPTSPLSPEEQAQAFAAINRSRRRHAELLAARGGRLYLPAAEDLDDVRAERERELQ